MPTKAKPKAKSKPPEKSLDQLIADAKADVAKDSVAVKFAQGRVDHFHELKVTHKRNRHAANVAHRPKKAAAAQRHIDRDNRKLHLWTGNEATAIELNRSVKSTLDRLLRKRAALQPHGERLATEAAKYVGTQEGSALQRKWAANLGYSSALPWCSIFAANMMLDAGLITREQLPSNPAYSGSWIGWPHGRRVNLSAARPGDLLIFDWGDGGLTDHVAIYVGGGQMIGGNQSHPGPSDSVSRESVPSSNVVAVIRVVD